MPKHNDDLFKRLRLAGVRKPVAKTLSELTEDAGKKALAAGRRAAAELRALAEEVEKRLPASDSALKTHDHPASATPAPRTATPATTPKSTKKASAPRRRPTPAASPAPRGENKAKILAALKTGPRTASEVSQETGIPAATVSAALTRLSKAGEVTKATRGYALPE